jgi:ATP:guanido phosphotransferase, C-terminal catalytic domain
LEEEEINWLKDNGIDVEKSAIHDAAGINDDWPMGRGVFINEQKEFVILVNFEDHLQIVVLSEGAELKKAFKTINKLINSFDKMGFATDPYHGNLTVSPEHLGTGIAIEGRVGYKHKFDAVIPKDMLDELDYGKQLTLENQLADMGKRFVLLKSHQTLAPNYTEN